MLLLAATRGELISPALGPMTDSARFVVYRLTKSLALPFMITLWPVG